MLAGGAFGIWLNKDAFGDLVGLSGNETVRVAAAPPAEPDPEPAAPADTPAEPEAPTEPAAAETPVPAEPSPAQPVPGEIGKFTQRLTPEGTETDPGPGGGEAGVGEGTSVAALTQPPSPNETASPPAADTAPDGEAEPGEQETAAPEAGVPAVADAVPEQETATAAPEAGVPAPEAGAPPAGEPAPGEQEVATTAPEAASPVPEAGPAPQAAVPAPQVEAAAAPADAVQVGQKAIFYEERTSAAEGSAEPGSIVWSLVEASPGGNLPAEPAIRAEATIPGKDLQLTMTIKRNADQTLPASHIIEMIFLTPEGFEGGGIENILRVAMKSSEQEAGGPLIGIPAKVADGFFLVALNDAKADVDKNLDLLRRQSWIDVPVVYKSGRRALLTMEKGIPGDKVFDEALKAWQAATAG
jgi:hypothetical protein